MNYFQTGGDLYQWDIGRKVTLALPEGETASVVEFTINNEANALVVDVKGNEAEIPNILLQTAGGLRMWAVTVTADGRQTRRYGSAPVYSRAKPDDYIYTETEVKRYEDFEDRLKALEENGGGAVESVNGQTGAVKLTAADVGAIPVDKPGTIKSTGVLIAGDGQPHYARMEGGDGRAMFSMRDKDGNILNRVSLRETETTLGQPLAINSGGHGGKTAAEGRENLSLYSKDEVDSKVAKIEGDVERLTEEMADIKEGGAHQVFVTDANGKTAWENRTHYKRDRITVKISPKFDNFIDGLWQGGYRSNDPAQKAASNAIGADLLKQLNENKAGEWVFYWDGVRYSRARSRIPVVVKPTNWPFGFQISINNSTIFVVILYNDDGQDHTLEWEMLYPELKPLDEDFMPTSVPVIQTAQVGQTIVVKSVDDTGKPTEWEAADMGAGGSGASFFFLNVSDQKLYHITNFDKDNNCGWVGEQVTNAEFEAAFMSGPIHYSVRGNMPDGDCELRFDEHAMSVSFPAFDGDTFDVGYWVGEERFAGRTNGGEVPK